MIVSENPTPAHRSGSSACSSFDDLDDARTSLQQVLALSLKVEVDIAANGAEALRMLGEQHYSLVITDLRMPKLSGLELLAEVQNRKLPVTVIVTTGHGSITEAVEAMQKGAYDFLTKPVDLQHLVIMVQRALRERALQDEVLSLPSDRRTVFLSQRAEQQPGDAGCF